jgi:hypothetical protein
MGYRFGFVCEYGFTYDAVTNHPVGVPEAGLGPVS